MGRLKYNINIFYVHLSAELVEELKSAVQGIVDLAVHSHNAAGAEAEAVGESRSLTEQNSNVRRLLKSIEDVLHHQVKPPRFGQVPKVWKYLENLDQCLPGTTGTLQSGNHRAHAVLHSCVSCCVSSPAMCMSVQCGSMETATTRGFDYSSGWRSMSAPCPSTSRPSPGISRSPRTRIHLPLFLTTLLLT